MSAQIKYVENEQNVHAEDVTSMLTGEGVETCISWSGPSDDSCALTGDAVETFISWSGPAAK